VTEVIVVEDLPEVEKMSTDVDELPTQSETESPPTEVVLTVSACLYVTF